MGSMYLHPSSLNHFVVPCFSLLASVYTSLLWQHQILWTANRSVKREHIQTLTSTMASRLQARVWAIASHQRRMDTIITFRQQQDPKQRRTSPWMFIVGEIRLASRRISQRHVHGTFTQAPGLGYIDDPAVSTPSTEVTGVTWSETHYVYSPATCPEQYATMSIRTDTTTGNATTAICCPMYVNCYRAFLQS